MVLTCIVGRYIVQVAPKGFPYNISYAKTQNIFMAFNMIFTIYNCATYFKSQFTVKSITNMQEKLEIFTF